MAELINILVPVVSVLGIGAMAATLLNGLRRPAPVPVLVKSRSPRR